jgi:hypothetical protein
MKRIMEMFEYIMVAVAFAEEGIRISFLKPKDNLHNEWGEQVCHLN